MFEWITVISLILFGLTLIVAEIIFVPGTTLVGVLGFIFLIIGIGLSFHYFGKDIGLIHLKQMCGEGSLLNHRIKAK
jgi:membrane-bound ClpP family serine protease